MYEWNAKVLGSYGNFRRYEQSKNSRLFQFLSTDISIVMFLQMLVISSNAMCLLSLQQKIAKFAMSPICINIVIQ